ncbi:MAG: PQQ-dependent sugar dehydrogenase, partial [Chloroflexota bacterium]
MMERIILLGLTQFILTLLIFTVLSVLTYAEQAGYPNSTKMQTALSPSEIITPTISYREIATGFSRPVDISHAGDDRLFVVEKAGVIKIIDHSGIVRSTSFLDIQTQVHSSGSEQGLLGLAFHPNYDQNGYFYVNYVFDPMGSGGTCLSSGRDCVTRISRFQVSS